MLDNLIGAPPKKRLKKHLKKIVCSTLSVHHGSHRLRLHIADVFLLRFPQNGRNFPSAVLSRTTAFGPTAHASGPALPDGSPASAP